MEFPTDSTFPMSSDTDTESSSDNDTLNFFVSVYNELDAESSRPKKKMVDRDRIRANEVLMNDYFVENPLYKHDGRAISPDWVPDPPTQVQVPQDINLQLRNEETHFRLRYDLIELVGSLGLEFPDSDEE
ncbi:hypothetical protein Hanom_Chr02g00153371 [Helianthus anomalus]